MKYKSLHFAILILTLAILSCTGPPAVYAYDPMCEFYEEHNGACCSDCHDMVSCATTNLFCVPSPISTPNSGEKPVVYNSINSQVKGTQPYNGVCEVCHTGTKYHRNNASGDHTHCVGQKCTSCHLHGPTTMVSKSLCYTCHGGESGDVPAGNPPMFTVPCLSGPSHDTHTQANAKGPAALACSVCHVGGVYDIDNMDLGAVCGDCHSPDGAFDGINGPTIGVKANWAEGVYEADGKTLKSGKERWCIGCHDEGTSVCDGMSAPDIGGDGSTYGYYVNGHKSRLCSACHDLTITHIDGKARTYAFDSAYYDPNQSGVAYASGYRLRYVDAEVPLMIPATYNITFGYNAQLIKANAFRLCFDCHDSSKILDDTPGDGLDTNFKASLPNPPRNYSYAWGSGADTNEHVAHILNYTGPFWDSDWDTGTNGAGGSNGRDSLTACPVCHNVHGAAGSQGSTNEPMIRDGNLAGRTGYGFSYVVEDGASYPMVTSTGATLPISVGSIFRNSTANMCAGSMCHGNPDPPAASSYDATGSSWGTYVEYYRATVTSNCSLCHAYGTDGSHPTHDNSTGKGVDIECYDCHNSGGHTNNTVDFADGNPLSTTSACDNCHSDGGAVNGVTMAKANWDAGIYEEDGTLKSGKEQWCVTCHDAVPANSKQDGTGISAPNKAGDNSSYGYYVTGHGTTGAYNATLHGQNGPGYACTVCHDTTLSHISGALDDSDRLKTVTDDALNYTSDLSEVCLDCHEVGQSSNGSLGYDATAEATVHSGGVSGNYNTNAKAATAFPAYGNSADYPTNPGYQCEDCHDVHGTQKLAMVLATIDGNLGGTSNPVSVAGFESTDSDLTDLDPSAAADNGACDVCHTSGGNPHPDTNHASNHNQGNTGNSCMVCHLHTSSFAHGAGGGSGCDECHGHDTGYGGATGGKGTYFSHSTHMENDSDDVMGPNIACSGCHNTSSYPDFKDGQTTLAATTVCNNCHSDEGALDGVVMAKANWTNGVYEADGTTIKSGKEQWCATCHDAVPANSKQDGSGVSAPNKAGDNTSYGYYVTGHGTTGTYNATLHGQNGPGYACTVCHDTSLNHISGTLDDSDRLKTVTDDALNYTSDLSEVCLDCHEVGQSGNGSLGYDATAEATVHSGGVSGNYNTSAKAGTAFPAYGDSADYPTNPGYQCEDCHDVHGTQKLAMVLATIDGNLGGTSNPVSVAGLESTDTDLTDLDPSGAADNGVCDACHASGGGSHSHPDTNHTGNHRYGNSNSCVVCHSHTASFAHGGGAGGAGCEDCHGHDAGTTDSYYRHDPLMDYVPQETGIYDITYMGLEESDCRSCHGASLAARHHNSQRALCPECYPPGESGCTYCHPVESPPGYFPKGDPSEYRDGTRMAHSCLAEECHPTAWLDPPPDGHGWHHCTEDSESGNCVACHDPNLIAPYSPVGPFAENEPHVLDMVPTPFACQNCHGTFLWGQRVAAAEDREPTGNFDPDNPAYEDAGHPSTYDHLDNWGVPVGYYEYGKAIRSIKRLHHMDKQGNVFPLCYMCHSSTGSWDDISWDPCNPELIRACESCHTKETLHAIHEIALPDISGWEAVGLHVPPSNEDATDLEPDTYRLFTTSEVCRACHSSSFWRGEVCQ